MISKATVKYITNLQHKKYRDECDAFVAEGPKVVTELLLQQIFECEALYFTKKGNEILVAQQIKIDNEKAFLVEDFELQKISALVVANAMVAVFKKLPSKQITLIKNELALMLDEVQDPGNLGTIIRTADWFGITTIYCSLATACCYSPKVVQSTMASLGRVHVIYVDLCTVLQNNTAIKKYATVLNGKDVATFGKIKEGIIIIGNEGNGISAAILYYATDMITIEKFGRAESLNASVAAGIVLHSLVG